LPFRLFNVAINWAAVVAARECPFNAVAPNTITIYTDLGLLFVNVDRANLQSLYTVSKLAVDALGSRRRVTYRLPTRNRSSIHERSTAPREEQWQLIVGESPVVRRRAGREH
jgi:hypothetical protein